MSEYEERFLRLYYKAANSSDPSDWLQACLAAKQMYNQTRKPEDEAKEHDIQYPAQ